MLDASACSACAACGRPHDSGDMAPAQRGMAADLHPPEDPWGPHRRLLGGQVLSSQEAAQPRLSTGRAHTALLAERIQETC